MKDDRDLELQEVSHEPLEPESPSDCDFCNLLCQTHPGKDASDPASMHFMTERELRVLASMRRLKEEVHEIKAQMRKLEGKGSSEEERTHSAKLEELRAEWRKMDQERMDAAEERMRLLGHIQ